MGYGNSFLLGLEELSLKREIGQLKKENELYTRTVEHDTKEIKLLTAEIDQKDEEIKRLRIRINLQLKRIVYLNNEKKQLKKPTDDKTKAYLMLQKIEEHFKYHHYFTTEDYEKMKTEEYQADVRREMIEDDMGTELDFIDLP